MSILSNTVLDIILAEVRKEMCRSVAEHGHFDSVSSGLCVVTQESKELWEAVFDKEKTKYDVLMEAIQTAGCALNLVYDFYADLLILDRLEIPHCPNCGARSYMKVDDMFSGREYLIRVHRAEKPEDEEYECKNCGAWYNRKSKVTMKYG